MPQINFALWAFRLKVYDYVNELLDEMNLYERVADRFKKETDDFREGAVRG